jgi:hypothetical protein
MLWHACSQLLVARSINVRSLTIFGDVLVQPAIPAGTKRRTTTINTAFILAKGTQARFTVNNTTWDKTATIFLRRWA